ncbi:MAG: DUF167 domain-containing protein [Acidobacteriota bacterium]
MISLTTHDDGSRSFAVKVITGAPRNALAGIDSGTLKVRLHAQPVEGKANEELCKFLAELLGVSKSRIEIHSGVKSRRKRIRVYGCDEERIFERLRSPQPTPNESC